MSGGRTLLTVMAHPDDESFGMGGTLAKYAREGVEVHVVIATDGAAGSMAEGFEVAREQLAAVRAQELEAAVKILGGHLHLLGYRDSGMAGSPANDHPDAFINSDDEDAIRKIVRLLRIHRPEVVVTHDETGGYYHPDHIRCWKITTAAFNRAGDPTCHPELDLPPFQPDRLYYSAIPKDRIKWFIRFRRLFSGEDPQRVGRNRDIDLTQLGIPDDQIHVQIDIRPVWDIKRQASAAHQSQGGGVGFMRQMPEWLARQLFGYELYVQAHPSPSPGTRKTDLFGY